MFLVVCLTDDCHIIVELWSYYVKCLWLVHTFDVNWRHASPMSPVITNVTCHVYQWATSLVCKPRLWASNSPMCAHPTCEPWLLMSPVYRWTSGYVTHTPVNTYVCCWPAMLITTLTSELAMCDVANVQRISRHLTPNVQLLRLFNALFWVWWVTWHCTTLWLKKHANLHLYVTLAYVDLIFQIFSAVDSATNLQ